MEVRMGVTAYTLFDDLWSGGRDTLEDLTVKEVEEVLQLLEETEPADGYTLTDINDFFWFERDYIAEYLGFEDYDELMKRGEEDEKVY